MKNVFCFISKLKFGSFTNPLTLLQQLLACLNFTLESEDLSFWYKQKKIISMNYGSSRSNWKPWRWLRFDLIFSMRLIYINYNLNPLTKLTSSSRSTELKDIFPWNISQMITKIIPISMRIAINYVTKQGILLWIWWESQWKLRNDQNFPMEGKPL